MKVTFSGIGIVDGTGKLGGTVIQGGRFGSVARRWIKPTVINTPNFNANSEKQFFRLIVARWRTLAAADRISWNPALPTGLSGFNYYTQANLIVYRLTGGFIDTKPVPVASPIITAMSYSIDSVTHIFTFNYTGGAGISGWRFNFFLANNYSTGVARARQSEYRLLDSTIILAGPNVWTNNAQIQGVSPITGSQCFMKLVIANKFTGQVVAPSYFSAICT